MKTIDPRYGRDQNLRLCVYWIENRHDIANLRRWECSGDCPNNPKCWSKCSDPLRRQLNCPTLKSYEHYITDVLDKYLLKPISAVTMDDIQFAISKLRAEYEYKETTLITVLSLIRTVFRYAHMHGDAYNIFRYTKHDRTSRTKSLDEILCSTHSESIIKSLLEEERNKLAGQTKSLTSTQIEQLSQYVWNNIESDGRLCLIALMLYAGVRPAEGRALLWSDITPFIDHPDRHLINLFKIRDENGDLCNRMKTENAYRRVPVHIELSAFLKKRRAYVQSQMGDSSIDNLPICCFKNEYRRPCKDFEAAMIAEDVFTSDLKLNRQDMYIYALEHISERFSDSPEDGKDLQHLSLYVLRKNFWTWLQALTTLSDYEKRVVMGHDLDGKKREHFNDENLLWNLCCKMDTAVLCAAVHEDFLTISLDASKSLSLQDQGIVRLRITKEMIAAGDEIVINAITEEVGDHINLRILNSLAKGQPHWIDTTTLSVAPLCNKVGINCAYENWLAHKKAAEKCAQLSVSAKSDSGSGDLSSETDIADSSKLAPASSEDEEKV